MKRAKTTVKQSEQISRLVGCTRREGLDKRIKFSCSVEYSIHGIANAESYAIDLFWDIIARYTHYKLLLSFYQDMLYIVDQEADHFLAWYYRLLELGMPFGSLPCHAGLWQSAEDTVLARLAIVSLTHEAKGLDSFMLTHNKFAQGKDLVSMGILELNYKEEIVHACLARPQVVLLPRAP